MSKPGTKDTISKRVANTALRTLVEELQLGAVELLDLDTKKCEDLRRILNKPKKNQ